MENFDFEWNGLTFNLNIYTEMHPEHGYDWTDVEIDCLAGQAQDGNELALNWLTTQAKDQLRADAFEWWLDNELENAA